MDKKYLMAPGPTQVPERVLLAMAAPIIHHRTPQFSAIFGECREGLKWLFQTEQEVIIHASSGSGAMEAALANTCSPGDKVITVNGGKFGERWGKIAKAIGCEPIVIDVEWGKPVDPAAVKKALDENPDARAVCVQASETSTTVAHPVAELAELVKGRDETILIVDGITALGVVDLPMDKTGIDVLVTGSQKALMLPPGLACIAFSEKAQKLMETSKCAKFYFNYAAEKKGHLKDTTAWTPAVTLVIGLRESLAMMREEGLEGIFGRHDRLARATRAAVGALGLKPLAPEAPAGSATGVMLPDNVDGAAIVKYLRDTLGVTIAGGQEHLKGKIVRISHMGYNDTFDTITAIAALEMALKKHGADIEMGKGVAAAQEILLEGYK